MSSSSDPKSLIDDLEAIKNSLEKISSNEPKIPTLDDMVAQRSPRKLNPSNPFLSSSSLSKLIKERNLAEQNEAHELAKLASARPSQSGSLTSKDPTFEQISNQIDDRKNAWIEELVQFHITLFEKELRQRLKTEYETQIQQWQKNESQRHR